MNGCQGLDEFCRIDRHSKELLRGWHSSHSQSTKEAKLPSSSPSAESVILEEERSVRQ